MGTRSNGLSFLGPLSGGGTGPGCEGLQREAFTPAASGSDADVSAPSPSFRANSLPLFPAEMTVPSGSFNVLTVDNSVPSFRLRNS
jgi:hypothetical protein